MHRSGCLELYYCNMVEWSWWDSSLICKTNYFPSVLWHCWFGHMTCKIVPDMTYNVFGGTLNLALSICWRTDVAGYVYQLWQMLYDMQRLRVPSHYVWRPDSPAASYRWLHRYILGLIKPISYLPFRLSTHRQWETVRKNSHRRQQGG